MVSETFFRYRSLARESGEKSSMRWYAAKTKAGQDGIALDNLKRQAFETYYPRMTVERYRNGQVRRDHESLFPGYVLVRFALETSSWKTINNTRGVYRLLSSKEDGHPSALPDNEVDWLQERERSGKLYISEIQRFRRGDQVRLKVGPSADQVGQVLRARGERVEVLLQLLGRQVRCIAPNHALALVPSHISGGSAVAMPETQPHYRAIILKRR
jgi:transcriptional antiterminator RfaH